MPSPRKLWRALLRVFRKQSHLGSPWVEPGNAITRAIYGGATTFATMESWQEARAVVEPPASQALIAEPEASPPASAPPVEQPPGQEDAPKRPGVAA